jgi:hypothetical protein
VNLFGSNGGSNGRGLLRRVAGTRNERGSALASASGSSSIGALPDIPRSKLYDPYAPITVSAQVDLTVPDAESLAVDVTVSGQSKDAAGVAVLAPQSKQGSISVSVKDGKGAAVANAEVTVLVVDKAVLDLMPYELQVGFCVSGFPQFICVSGFRQFVCVSGFPQYIEEKPRRSHEHSCVGGGGGMQAACGWC